MKPIACEYPTNALENYLRESYFTCDCDLGGSGVQPYTMGELRGVAGLKTEMLDVIRFLDSDSYAGAPLRSALASRFMEGDENQVMATHGSSEALYLALQVLATRGSRVVVLSPSYQQLHSVVQQRGCELAFWLLRATDGFVPDLDEFERLMKPGAQLVIANFPHNPTGATLSLAEFTRFLSIIERHRAWLLWDGAFSELTEEPLPNPVHLYARAVATGTLSKAYGFPGLRVGWLLAARPVLEQCVALRDYLTLFLSPFVEILAAAVLNHAAEFIAPRWRQAKKNLSLLTEAAQQWGGVAKLRPPAGGVCTFLEITTTPKTDRFCAQLMEAYRTLVVPGSCFKSPRFVRLGFGTASTEFARGLSHFSEALQTEIWQ